MFEPGLQSEYDAEESSPGRRGSIKRRESSRQSAMKPVRSPAHQVARKPTHPQRALIPVLLPFLRSSARSLARITGAGRLPHIVPAEGRLRGQKVAIAYPLLGAPAAILVLEEAIMRGYRDFFFLGSCGGLDKDLHIGDIVLPDEAISEEGTSQLYTSSGPRFSANIGLTKLIESTADEIGMAVRRGTVWSTDAPFRENPAKIRKFRRLGAIGVDMETSALFAVAKVRRARMAGLLVVSDLLHDEWIVGWNRKTYQRGEDKARNVLLEAAIRLADNLKPSNGGRPV